MALISALVTTDDQALRTSVARALRSRGLSLGFVEERASSTAVPDVVVVDIRSERSPGLPAVERLRAKWPAVSIFAVAGSSEPDVILQAMRAGANEFFTWPTAEESLPRPMEDELHRALGSIAERLQTAHGDATPTSQTFAFFGAKGGAGTTTLAVNCGVQLARLSGRPTIIIDLKPFLGDVALFLGAHPRFTLLDAVDNLHRLDAEFLRELVAKHPSGLDILAGSDTVDRPNGQEAGALEELVQRLGDYYEFVVIDAGNVTSASAEVAVFAADLVFLVLDALNTAIRNPQRILDRIEQMGGGKDRIRILLNRTSELHFIAPEQVEAALGCQIHYAFPNDYRTVSVALNAGVPVSLQYRSTLATEFVGFTRGLAELPATVDDSTARVGTGIEWTSFGHCLW